MDITVLRYVNYEFSVASIRKNYQKRKLGERYGKKVDTMCYMLQKKKKMFCSGTLGKVREDKRKQIFTLSTHCDGL